MEIGQKAIDLSLKERLLTKFWTVWLSERSYDSQFYHLGGRPLKIHFPDHSCGPLPTVTSTRARTHTHTHTHERQLASPRASDAYEESSQNANHGLSIT